jgi:hypothetical protein
VYELKEERAKNISALFKTYKLQAAHVQTCSYRLIPLSDIPIFLKGFNTGVVLYRLDRMRKSELYNSYLTSAKVKELVDK